MTSLSALIAETVETMSNISAKKDKGKRKAVASVSHSGGSSSDHSNEDEYNGRINMGAVRLLNALKTQLGEQMSSVSTKKDKGKGKAVASVRGAKGVFNGGMWREGEGGTPYPLFGTFKDMEGNGA
ncbi:hypothetical protein Cni_G16279 [Canna indica]|uniref:Uncharacterized protein n=1 Tax=Canna indica TaxID=4628 RepID=A0AAQ3KHH7_9LILI|nr:hypothetical protein Cni_G16279 [Canna indica]